MVDVKIRDVHKEDIKKLFDQQRDPEANRMAAFVMENPNDWEQFRAHWDKIMENETITKKTITVGDDIAGNVMSFELFGKPSVSYWIERSYWGKGIATNALKLLLDEVTTRPLYARAAKDNVGSLKVLQKCGFKIIGEDKGFSNARKEEVEEFILNLEQTDKL